MFKKIIVVCLVFFMTCVCSISINISDVSLLAQSESVAEKKQLFKSIERLDCVIFAEGAELKKDEFNSYRTAVLRDENDSTNNSAMCFFSLDDEIPNEIIIPEKTVDGVYYPKVNLVLHETKLNVRIVNGIDCFELNVAIYVYSGH